MGPRVALRRESLRPAMLIGFAAAPSQQGEGVKGHGAGLATSLLLTAAMGMRFARTRKPMPAGVLSAAGALASAYHFNKYQEWVG